MSEFISTEAPIGFIWLTAFPHKLKPGVHPLPNTDTYPYQQNLKTMAEIHHNRKIIVYYFGKLNEQQRHDMENLSNLCSNIQVVDFFSIDWEKKEYNFSFVYNDQNVTLLDFLLLDNDDNLIGLRKDIAEHLLLLSNPKGIIFIDFDSKILEPIYEPLPTSVGLLCGWDYEMNNRFDFFVNNAMVVSGPKHKILVQAFDELKSYLMLNGIDTDAEDQFTLTSENVSFKNLHNFTGEWKLVFLLCDFQCCSLVSALSDKFGIDAFDKNLIKKAESTTAFKRVLVNNGNYLSIETKDASRTWLVDNKYEIIFNNMYEVPYLPLKTEFRGTINFNKTNPKPLDVHIIVSSKIKFNMVNQFIKLNPERQVYVYTFPWVKKPKNFGHEIIMLNYTHNLSVLRLAMVDILYNKGGICWTTQHNPIKLPDRIDEREISCLTGCRGQICGAHICFDIVAVDKPKHKILCEVKELVKRYKKYFQITLNPHLYLDSHPNYVEYAFENGTKLSENLVDVALWYSISGYTPIAKSYAKTVSFEDLIIQSQELVTVDDEK